MRRKKILIFPKLNDRKGDLSKQWFVELSMRNPQTGEMIRRRYEKFEDKNLNKLSSKQERYIIAEKLIQSLTEKINKGWTIFEEEKHVVYEDQLQYHSIARIYKEKIESNNTYNFWINKYLTEFVAELKKETRDTYTSRYRVFEIWLKSKQLHKYDIEVINNAVIIDFFSNLKNEKKLSKRTYSSYYNLLHAFFEYVLKKGSINQNPVFNIPKNRIEKDMGAEAIFEKDMELLMKTIDSKDKQLGLACRFEYYCGMRPGYEIRFLKIADIDFKRGRVRVSWETAKVSRKRDVILPDVFLKYLMEEWNLHNYDKNYYVIGKYGIPNNEHLGKNNLRTRFRKIREGLGLPEEYKFYSFKHTGAVTLAEKGEAIINIRDHLGHQSMASTEHYLKRLGVNNSKLIKSDFPEI